MNPNRKETPSLEEAGPEVEPLLQGQEAVQEASIEAPQETEGATGKQASPIADQPILPIQIPQGTNGTSAVAVTDNPQNDGRADIPDSDRIDKQWVDRAKEVIAQTQEDPYAQKNKMSEVKADYIKRRFNKTIKLGGAAE